MPAPKDQKKRAEWSRKISESNRRRLGEKRSEQARVNISKALVGRIFSEEHKKNIGLANVGKTKGIPRPNYRKPDSHVSWYKKGHSDSIGEKNGMYGKPAPNKGIPHKKSVIRKMSIVKGGDGDLSRLFLKENVKADREWKCELCDADKNVINSAAIPKLDFSIHHIDRNNKNNSLDNVMVLCSKCHMNVHHHGQEVQSVGN